MRVVKIYQGKRRNECPPHLWAITETAYRNMISGSKDQSMLITGESGAGKTENTKKVISYLAVVATKGKKMEKKVSLEDQIVATNPILESYGNAKTSRNDNSSRFGKFIRIHFNNYGKLAGCDIKAYLFEKSRITQQQEVERSYHIFYQLLQTAVPKLKERCLLTDNIYDYSYVCQGRTKVDSINDNEELQFTDNAFDIIGFTKSEKWECYKLTAAVMTMGDLKFKQKGREEQCEPEKTEVSTKVGILCGVDSCELMTAFSKPKIKVGTEWVIKGQIVEQATNAVGGIARAIYHRTFLWLIEKCNETLVDITMKKVNFCAVLDIAGFEIFTYNGYEQLSINFVNEKLQQFFNHHMFVIEQETYISEGIDWQMVDFGMDLAACIIMFEKPMGIWAILEEESLFPKASDKTLEDKLKATLLGKCPSFAKPQSKTDKNAHFSVVHYAGTVSYNVTAWLEKNKDPVNDTVVDIMKDSRCALLVHIWREHPGQHSSPSEEKGKKKKAGGGKTVSSVFLVDLHELMKTLNNTDPHFVRCIVPNMCKQPGGVDPPLIMHQLTCNGVLEGIRICMRGFPNRIEYEDFKQRYNILARGFFMMGDTAQNISTIILEKHPSVGERAKLGHTKVFFRAGALAELEDKRDEVLNDLIQKMQGVVFGYKARKKFEFKRDQRNLIKVIQRTFRKYLHFKNWRWFSLIQLTRPLIGEVKMEEVIEKLEERETEATSMLKKKLEILCEFKSANISLAQEVTELREKAKGKFQNMEEYQDKEEELKLSLSEMKNTLKKKQCELSDIETMKEEAADEVMLNEEKIIHLESLKKDLKCGLKENFQELLQGEKLVNDLKFDVEENDKILCNLNAEKKQALDCINKSENVFLKSKNKQTILTEKLNEMNDEKEKVMAIIDDDKSAREEIEKARKHLESILKMEKTKVHNSNLEREQLEEKHKNVMININNFNDKLKVEEENAKHNQSIQRSLQDKIDQMETELYQIKQDKMNAELNRSVLARRNVEFSSQLEEAEANTFLQMTINDKLEARINEMRKEKEEQNISWESSIMRLKKKHNEATNEMTQQLEALRNMKAKAEKDIFPMQNEIRESRSAIEKICNDVVHGNKTLTFLHQNLSECNKKYAAEKESMSRIVKANLKVSKTNSEASENLSNLKNCILVKERDNHYLAEQLMQANQLYENEERERNSLSGKLKTLEHEYDGYKEQFVELEYCKRELQFSHECALSEVNTWNLKFEKEIKERVEDLETTKLKLQGRLIESEGMLETLLKKLNIEEQRKKELSR